SMATVEDGVVRKREQLALDTRDQGFAIAAGQVGAADGAGKQHVAAEDDAVSDQADAPRRMTGRVADREAQRADRELFALHHVAIGGRRPRRSPEPEPRRLLRHGVVERPVRGMQPHGPARFADDSFHAEHVIEMPMREPDRDRLRAGLGDLVQDQPGFLARIDDGALRCLLVDHDVTVLGEHTVGNLDDLHVLTGLPSPSRNAFRNFSTAMAAVVASPTAVVIWRVTWLRTSPAANSPDIEVIILLSVMR